MEYGFLEVLARRAFGETNPVAIAAMGYFWQRLSPALRAEYLGAVFLLGKRGHSSERVWKQRESIRNLVDGMARSEWRNLFPKREV